MFLDELKSECDSCRRCELCESRNNIVFGVGNENADIMLIGEAPGENEDMQGQPFVGRSGKLLDEMIGEYGLSRDKNIYIANMLKFRPPKKRDPQPS
ncbi:uracil-DNA glycosylase, partial [Eubacterium sp.]|uniref:uracil-DNA glycosylase n=1 Tax=Eubacterium sp. TaxID=142586 RepID=UPI004026DE5E